MTITSQPIQRRPLSHIARVRLAEQAYAERQAERSDPHRALVTKVRAAHLGLAQVHQYANREFERQNTLVPAPPGAAGLLHPTRTRLLAEFMAREGWSADGSAAVGPMPTRAEIAGSLIADAHADIEQAEAALNEFEDERRRDALGLDDEDEPVVPPVTAETAKRGPGRPKAAIPAVEEPHAVAGQDLSQVWTADD